jgi:Phycobilisome protein
MLTVRTLNTLRDRLPTADERDRLIAYAHSARVRLAAAREIEAVGDAVVEDVMARMKRLYPNIPRYHGQGFEKGYRDNRLLLSYIAKCMFLDDPALLDEQVLVWVRTLFKSFNFTPKFLRDNFTLMRESVRGRVMPRTFALAEPLLDHTIAFMSDIPEPARAEV